MEITVEKVIDKQKVADTIHSILEVGIGLLNKESYKPVDHTKIKVIRTLNGSIGAAVNMVCQETAQIRAKLLLERMKQLGYDEREGITE